MEEDPKEYRWETGYEKTWEAITEDADGLIEFSVQDMIQKAKRKRMMEKLGKTRLGMMRHLYLIVDLSECMKLQDLKPTRILCTSKLLESFVEEFFYLNPISQLGLIVTRNKRAELISELAGNPRKHLENIRKLGLEFGCNGEPSLQNSLRQALQTLRHMPGHASREVLVVMGSLTTCDPGDIQETIDECKTLNVRCSVISLAAEVRIYRELAKTTSGDFNVILDDCHFRDLLFAQLEPPPSAAAAESSLIKMGFPCHSGQDSNSEGLGMCMCHLDAPGGSKLTTSGFLCPQCQAKYCELPVECKACGLTLVSAPHLARSYHHLFPLPAFRETTPSAAAAPSCFSCIRVFNSDKDIRIYQCPDCEKNFCSDCDIFIHETLHTCPGCASKHAPVHVNGVS